MSDETATSIFEELLPIVTAGKSTVAPRYFGNRLAQLKRLDYNLYVKLNQAVPDAKYDEDWDVLESCGNLTIFYELNIYQPEQRTR